MYDLSRNRFKELKHFCLQYPEMKRRLEELYSEGYNDEFDPTGRIASEIADIKRAMNLIETTAFNLENFPGEEVFEIVTRGKCRGDVGELYLKKFYWCLSQRKAI